jgi:hypothetical protein
MKLKFVSAVAVLAVLAATPVVAQDKAPPKANKADVQKLVDSIKADKAKMAEFCVYVKLQAQADEAAEKKDEKKVADIEKQAMEAGQKIGPDFVTIALGSEMDDESGALLEALAKSCS